MVELQPARVSRTPAGAAALLRELMLVRKRLLVLPVVGVIDLVRARRLAEQLLVGIQRNRAKVVVLDLSGVPPFDAAIATHLAQTVQAATLVGATVILTGLSPEIHETLASIGVDVGKLNTAGDLQDGIAEAERRLGYPATARPESGSGT